MDWAVKHLRHWLFSVVSVVNGGCWEAQSCRQDHDSGQAAGEHPFWCHRSSLCYSCLAEAEHAPENTFLLHGLATFQFYLLILFICVPQKNVCRLYLLSAELHHLPVTFNILFLFWNGLVDPRSCCNERSAGRPCSGCLMLPQESTEALPSHFEMKRVHS